MGVSKDDGPWTHNPPRKSDLFMNSGPPLPRAGPPARSHCLMFTGLAWLIPMALCACSAILFIQGLIWKNRGVYFGIFPIDGSHFCDWKSFLHTCCTSGQSESPHASWTHRLWKDGAALAKENTTWRVHRQTIDWAQRQHRKWTIRLIKPVLFLLSLHLYCSFIISSREGSCLEN